MNKLGLIIRKGVGVERNREAEKKNLRERQRIVGRKTEKKKAEEEFSL